MPTYEYACTQCANQVEVYQSFTDPPLETCEVCSGKLRRVYHPVAVVFKGSGFYSTDARANRAGTKKKDGKDQGKAGKDSSAASGGGESPASGGGESSKSSSGDAKAATPRTKKAEAV
ncbi:MAG: FmdB family zinc ribbon protein [Actinomycetota bacterium]